jgi:SAM-dependent methyltransferase
MAVISRRAIAVSLERVKLQHAAFRVWEWGRSARALPEVLNRSRRHDSDGLPLPAPLYRVQVTGMASRAEFLAQSYRAEGTIRDAVRRAGGRFEDLEAVLDFGCGCGRVMRRWAGVSGPAFFGSDYNPKLIRWCQENLTFAQFEVNGLAPPLPFADGQFDLVYALSVFTHLSQPLQREWLAELGRVITPGGLLVFTTRGDAWAWKLTPDERRLYESGRPVVRYSDVSGTNLCSVLHPWSYVHKELADGFVLHESWAAGLADGAQDVHIARRVA